MTDFVLDFETLATKADCVVLSLAVTPFDRDKLKSFQEYIEDTEYWKFEVGHQVEAGRIIDPKTLDWWSKQDPIVREREMNPSVLDVRLDDFIILFYEFCKSNNIGGKSIGWARGKEFDFGILGDIISKFKHNLDKDQYPINETFFPVPFWGRKDIRDYISGLVVDPTITKVPLPKDSLPNFEHHNPIHDCARAVLHIKYAEMYARGELEVPEKDDADPFSNK